MPSFGEKLRREREKRTITLEQISQSTKIGTRMLQALEEDRFNQLPGGIFNKGFVRAYARHLGLDEDQTVAEYLEASGEAQPVQPEIPQEESARHLEASTEVPSRPLPWGAFAAILLLVALVLSIWSHRQRKPEAVAPPTSPSPAAAQPAVDDHASQAATVPASASSTSEKPESSILSTVRPTVQVTSAGAPAGNSATVSPTTPPHPTALPAPGEFLVVVQAREDSWTAIQSDGRLVYSGVLTAGDQRAVRGRKEVVVKAGNVGGVDLHFNGKKLDRLGENGQVRTLTFGPDGLTQNSLASPPTQ